jgi:mRNA-degrading endonuclease RelE of RelBE toxin-antitoxin system
MYNIRITKQAMKDIADLPKGYARLLASTLTVLRTTLIRLIPSGSEAKRTTAYV